MDQFGRQTLSRIRVIIYAIAIFFAETRLAKKQGVIQKVNVITVQFSYSLCTITPINLGSLGYDGAGDAEL